MRSWRTLITLEDWWAVWLECSFMGASLVGAGGDDPGTLKRHRRCKLARVGHGPPTQRSHFPGSPA